MRLLFVSFVVVLLISEKSAVPVQLQDNIKVSGKTESLINNDKVKALDDSVKENGKSVKEDDRSIKEAELNRELHSENEIPEEVTVKRSKKSNYPSVPCSCSVDQYGQASVAYNTQPIPYGQPSYEQPQYSPPKYGGRKGHKGYGRPSYQQPQPSYESSPVYQPAPIYSAYDEPPNNYNAPSYSAPSYTSQVYSAPVYPSPAPSVPCSSSVVVSCQPHVSHVPCSGYSSSYAAPEYVPPPQHSQPEYRYEPHIDSAVSSQPANTQNESKNAKVASSDKTPSETKTTGSKYNAVSLALPATSDDSEKNNAIGTESDNSDSQQPQGAIDNPNAKVEETKARQHQTFAKMAEMFGNTKSQNQPPPSFTAIEQQQQQQQQQPQQQQPQQQQQQPQQQQQNSNAPKTLPPQQNPQQNARPNAQQTTQQNMSPPTPATAISGPPPTSMNTPMNAAASNQINTNFLPTPQFPQWK